jgi:hypothetical protein
MNLELTKDITMVAACIKLANDPNYISVWQGQPPEDFATDLGEVSAAYEAVLKKEALADAAAGGGGNAKAAAETVLENAAFKLARALVNHFTKTGDLVNLAKTDYQKNEIKKLRDQDLYDQSTALRDLGTATVTETGAAGRGVTTANVTTVTNALDAYKLVMGLPRGQVINRSALKKEVETDVAALVTKVASMDDLVIQFDGTDLGKRFIEAWKSARMIVNTGGGHATKPAPAPGTTTSTSPTPAPSATPSK